MPFTMNGVGTSVVGSRGDIGWGSYDAMEWFVVFFLPIVPYKSVHTFDWNGDQYRMVPIRWSWDLTLRTFLNHWSIGIAILGVILGVVGIAEWAKPVGLPMLLGGFVLLLLGILAQVAVRISDRRNKNIRIVLAGLTIGTCDPVHLQDDLLEQMTGNTKMLYGTDTYADAVESLLAEGRIAHAMWAARMTTAIEDPHEGERLTDLLLGEPAVLEAIDRVKEKPDRWAKVMLTKEERIQLDVRAPGSEYFPPSEEKPRPSKKRRRDDDEEPPRRRRDED